VILDGPCPFLRCLDTEVHAHAACADCGAINHGNINCRTCVETWDCNEDTKQKLLASFDRPGGAA
jgi:hypothetical protein